MGFSEGRKERNINAHQKYVETLAKETITLDTFDGKLFIAYDDTPVMAVEPDWTPENIVGKLEEMRGHFIESKMKCYAPKFMDLLFG